MHVFAKPLTVFSLIAALAMVALPAEPRAETPSDAESHMLMDHAELARIPTEIELAVDAKNWPHARSFFADDVRVDFTSLVGGEPAIIPSDDLITGWAANLTGNKESLHMRGWPLIDVDGDRATVRSNGYAYNKLPGAPDGSGDLWEVWGHYTHDFERTEDGWKVVGFTFEMTHERGSDWVKTTPGS
ncbi:MAG: nuclear transport factor 2 family protein [Pseudomonadota bacterium]